MIYHMFIDDSGQLHKNSNNDYFSYGGILVSEEKLNQVKLNYKNCVNRIKKSLNMNKPDELKATMMGKKHKIYLLNNLKRNCLQIFIIIKKDYLDRVNLTDSRDIVRFKNFSIRYLIQGLFMNHTLENCTELQINIDNQNIAVSAKDSLEDYLHNTFNFDDYYIKSSSSRFCKNNIKIKVQYKSSHTDYLIQAADLLANTKWRKFAIKNCEIYKYLQDETHCVKLPNSEFTSGKFV